MCVVCCVCCVVVLCCVELVVGGGVVWCCVVCGAACHAEKRSVLMFSTPPCVHFKCPHLCRHTRGRSECTHGGVLDMSTEGEIERRFNQTNHSPTKSGHCPTNHRINKQQSICHSSLCLDLVIFPVLNRIKPQAPLTSRHLRHQNRCAAPA